MDTIKIMLINPKACKLLEDMDDLSLFRIIKDSSKISSLRGTIKSPMSNEEINKQLKGLRR